MGRLSLIPVRLTLAVLSGSLLIGLAGALDASRTRLEGLNPQRRSELQRELDRFDQILTNEEQRSVRDLDDRLQRLAPDESAHYLAVLQRYHVWLATLPENTREAILKAAPAERMAQIRSLLAKYPAPAATTPHWMLFADIAGVSPLELAAMFKLSQSLTTEQRKEMEGAPIGKRRGEFLFRHGQARLLRELHPADLVEREWITKAEEQLHKLNSMATDIKEVDAGADLELDEEPKSNHPDGLEKAKAIRLRRLAHNLYYLHQPPPRRVDPEKLSAFYDVLPGWVRTNLDTYPPDEVRRRLALAYRIVFPFPAELKAQPQAASRPPATPGKKASPEPSTRKPGPRTESAAPKKPSAAPF